jgi:hypothetical protein
MKKQIILIITVLATIQSSCRQADESVEQQIRNVEQGLMPGVIIKGNPSWTIQERMAHYNVPGVSVAVIHDYKSHGQKDMAFGIQKHASPWMRPPFSRLHPSPNR